MSMDGLYAARGTDAGAVMSMVVGQSRTSMFFATLDHPWSSYAAGVYALWAHDYMDAGGRAKQDARAEGCAGAAMSMGGRSHAGVLSFETLVHQSTSDGLA